MKPGTLNQIKALAKELHLTKLQNSQVQHPAVSLLEKATGSAAKRKFPYRKKPVPKMPDSIAA